MTYEPSTHARTGASLPLTLQVKRADGTGFDYPNAYRNDDDWHHCHGNIIDAPDISPAGSMCSSKTDPRTFPLLTFRP